MDEELLSLLEKIFSEGEVDKIQIRLDGCNYHYLSKEEPKDEVLRWEGSKKKVSENWWWSTY